MGAEDCRQAGDDAGISEAAGAGLVSEGLWVVGEVEAVKHGGEKSPTSRKVREKWGTQSSSETRATRPSQCVRNRRLTRGLSPHVPQYLSLVSMLKPRMALTSTGWAPRRAGRNFQVG